MASGAEPPAAAAAAVEAQLESVGLAADAGAHVGSLNQATFFRLVADGNLRTLGTLLRQHPDVDLDAYNDEGITALHLAVYGYENERDVGVLRLLLEHGADAGLPAATPPSAHKISIVRHDRRHPHGEALVETRKISVLHKTPLLLALELKSSLYLRGWEYRHWDAVLELLAAAGAAQLEKKGVTEVPLDAAAVLSEVQRGWAAIYRARDHELVEVWAEGSWVPALKLLLYESSKLFKANIEPMTALSAARLHIKDASFPIVQMLIQFIYTGHLDTDYLERRGLDLLRLAHKYSVTSLVKLCEQHITIEPENWIKVLHVAIECKSELLGLKCYRSIRDEMARRVEKALVHTMSYSDRLAPTGGPQQLFQPAEGLSEAEEADKQTTAHW
eukprot:SM000092S24500  [mRNA]  locus=s92:351482:353338:+ [translate_table: standard]